MGWFSVFKIIETARVFGRGKHRKRASCARPTAVKRRNAAVAFPIGKAVAAKKHPLRVALWVENRHVSMILSRAARPKTSR